MKTWVKTSALGLTAAIILCLAARAQLNGIIQGTLTPAPDSIVQITAEAMGLEAVALEDLPRGGTYWWVTSSGTAAPLPFPPLDRIVPIYTIADGQFLVDDTGGQVAQRALRWNVTQSRSSSQTVSAVDRLGNAVADLIEQIQQTQFERTMMMSLGFPSPGEGGGGTNGGDSGYFSTYTIDTNLLWLEITNVSNGWSHLNLHSGTNPFTTSQVFAILTKTNLLDATWNIETIISPTTDQTNVMPFTVQNFERDILFFRAQDWTGVTGSGNITPDWWLWKYFGTTSLSDTNLDANGNTLLSDYTNHVTPTVFKYTGLVVPNNYVSSSQPTVQLDVVGAPYYIATLIDDGNFSNAVWNAYSGSSVTVNLGTSQGWHDVWIGLRGHADDPASAVWQLKRLKLDWTPPSLVITNPPGGTADIPMIQLQGYSPEALSSISYDLSNAAGMVTNQQVLVLNQFYTTNTWEFTTNTFQAFDVVLTNGVNTFTLHATDLAGNVATLVTNITVDYSAKTNPPNLQIFWPQDQMQISGSNVTVRGLVDDATVTLTASMIDTNGTTNIFSGLVERNGKFWLENLPLNSGTNTVTVTASDVVGNQSETNLTLVRSAVTVTIDAVTDPAQLWQATVNLTGTISDPTYAVWVNGVQGVNHGDSTWSADNVPTTPGGVANFNVTIYPPGEAPAANAGGNGVNPQTPNASNGGANPDKPDTIYLTCDSQECELHTYEKEEAVDYVTGAPDYVTEQQTWDRYEHIWLGNFGGEANSEWKGQTDNVGPGIPDDHYTLRTTTKVSWWTDAPPGEAVTVDFDGNVTTNAADYIPEIATMGEHCMVPNVPYNPLPEVFSPAGILGVRVSMDTVTRTHRETYKRKADTALHVKTGGKALPARQNLWRFNGGASEITDKRAVPPLSGQGITNKTRISIGSMGKLGADGNRWVVLPDDQDIDVTPTVAGLDFYTFSVSGQKYTLTILASSSTTNADLSTDTPEFCVGQKVTFAAAWDTELVAESTNYIWNFSGKYVNHSSQANSQSSVNYDIDLSLLDVAQPCAWWYSGGNKNAYLHERLHFSNGQSVTVSASGQFSMFRPSVVMVNAAVHGPPENMWLTGGYPNVYPASPPWTGFEAGIIGLGVASVTNNMCFDVQVLSPDFAGDAKITQLCTIDATHYPTDISISGNLDNSDPYPNAYTHVYTISANSFTGGPLNVMRLDDAPQGGGFGSFHFNGSFTDYIMFTPGGLGDIYVPLGKLTWGTSFEANYPNVAINPNLVTDPQNPDCSEDWPVWTAVFSNPN